MTKEQILVLQAYGYTPEQIAKVAREVEEQQLARETAYEQA